MNFELSSPRSRKVLPVNEAFSRWPAQTSAPVGSPSRSRLSCLMLIGGLLWILASLFALLPAPASAEPKGVYSAFGTQGAGDGEFAADAPQGIAVAPNGDLYVVDSGNHRVMRMTAGGAFASQIGTGSSGSLGGEFNTPRGVTVDPADGSVYVTDGGNLRVQKFSSTGNFIAAFGFNVDNVNPSTGFEVCTVTADCRNGASGTADGQFGSTFIGHPTIDADGALWVADGGQTAGRRVQNFDGDTFAFRGKFGSSATYGSSSPSRAATDSDGNLYVVAYGNQRVDKCTPEGAPPAVTATCTTFASFTSNTAPLAIAVNRGTIANPGDNHIFIAHRSDGSTSELVIEEYLPDGTPAADGVHGQGAGIAEGLSATNGRDRIAIAVRTAPNGSTNRIFITNGGANNTGPHVYVLAALQAPEATLGPVTGISATGATFNGTVNPNGSPATYRFELSTDGGDTWAPAQSDQSAGSGDSPIPVTYSANDLVGGQPYRVRLVSRKPYNGPSHTSADHGFTTQAAEPTVATSEALQIVGDRAVLHGTVNPNNQETTYRFEYGKTTAYGHAAPLPDAPLSATNRVLSLAQPIAGLDRGATYHYRLVAKNASGVSATSDRTFKTPNYPQPPQGTEYEMVSPLEKNGLPVAPADSLGYNSRVSKDGNSVYFMIPGSTLADSDGGSLWHAYHAVRDAGQWSSKSVVPLGYVGSAPGLDNGRYLVAGVSADLTRSVLTSAQPLTEAGWPGGASTVPLYVHDTVTMSFELVTPEPLVGSTPYGGNLFMGGSSDYSKLLIETPAILTEDAVGLPSAQNKVYLWEDGEQTLVSILPDGTATVGSAANAAIPFLPTVGSSNESPEGAISANGEVIYFTAPFGAPSACAAIATGCLFRYEGGESELVNRSENDDETVPEGPAKFEKATRDGQRVLFSSTQRLLASDTNGPCSGSFNQVGCIDLYLYTHTEDPDTDDNLTLVTKPIASGANSDIQGIIGMADDASRIYFVARGQMTNDAPAGAGDKAYLWEDGAVTPSGEDEIRYLGTLTQLTGGSPWLTPYTDGPQDARSVSAQGESLAVRSRANLDPDRDNGGTVQVYLYRVSDDRWRCISCPVDKVPVFDAAFRYRDTNTLKYVEETPRYMSDDGEIVLFQTREALVPDDVNGTRLDVYAWQDGQPRLVSSGTSTSSSFTMNISGDGKSIFFTTAEQLVPHDTDQIRDAYVARVGGGMPQLPPPPPALCDVLGGLCEERDTATAPRASQPATVGVDGEGNVTEQSSVAQNLCRAQIRRAQRIARRAKAMRQKGRRASGRHAQRLNRRGARLSRKARKARKSTRQCRGSARSTGASRRAQR